MKENLLKYRKAFVKGFKSSYSYEEPGGMFTNIVWAIIFFVVFIWAIDGWQRVDCYVGVKSACAAMDRLYEKTNK